MTKRILLFLLFLSMFLVQPLSAAPKAELWPRWQDHDPASTQVVDHSAWQAFLDKYLVADHPSGVNRVRYGSVSEADRKSLDRYLGQLQQTPVTQLNRNEQMAYWFNFYNALTIQVVLEHYPVSSIRRINISPGWFSSGPWGAKLVEVEGEKLSLDDIEHRILRPVWQDARIHYAVNCASIGCPNLQPRAFTAANLDSLLTAAARQYINHPRGVSFDDGRLQLSSIYEWFQEDFEDSREGVLRHLQKYAEPELAAQLASFDGKISYEYDWSLNDTAP
ncbi:MAG TPA: DUF547 domain-containing protein [Geoalkalibacter subterraneus]|uniref:DUF547 domain-containing protein n=1 Tax=Geoalkalibacter subterraneus TaxID=483547 RepID=A0A831LU39_9BACT|nr:DUF547 domain-containing protein [Geoalkalibacter subterraneus]